MKTHCVSLCRLSALLVLALVSYEATAAASTPPSTIGGGFYCNGQNREVATINDWTSNTVSPGDGWNELNPDQFHKQTGRSCNPSTYQRPSRTFEMLCDAGNRELVRYSQNAFNPGAEWFQVNSNTYQIRTGWNCSTTPPPSVTCPSGDITVYGQDIGNYPTQVNDTGEDVVLKVACGNGGEPFVNTAPHHGIEIICDNKGTWRMSSESSCAAASTPGPTLTFRVSLSENQQGQPVAEKTVRNDSEVFFTWSSDNTLVCAKSGAWSGYAGVLRNAPGFGVKSQGFVGTKTYTLTCSDGTRSARKSIRIRWEAPPSPDDLAALYRLFYIVNLEPGDLYYFSEVELIKKAVLGVTLTEQEIQLVQDGLFSSLFKPIRDFLDDFVASLPEDQIVPESTLKAIRGFNIDGPAFVWALRQIPESKVYNTPAKPPESELDHVSDAQWDAFAQDLFRLEEARLLMADKLQEEGIERMCPGSFDPLLSGWRLGSCPWIRTYRIDQVANFHGIPHIVRRNGNTHQISYDAAYSVQIDSDSLFEDDIAPVVAIGIATFIGNVTGAQLGAAIGSAIGSLTSSALVGNTVGFLVNQGVKSVSEAFVEAMKGNDFGDALQDELGL